MGTRRGKHGVLRLAVWHNVFDLAYSARLFR